MRLKKARARRRPTGCFRPNDEFIYRAKDFEGRAVFKHVPAVQLEHKIFRPGDSDSVWMDAITHNVNGQGEAIMRRVVITGMGIVSNRSGNNTSECLRAFHEAISGITRAG